MHPRCPPPFCFIPNAGPSMFVLSLADTIARLAASPALAVLRDQNPSAAARVAVGGQPGSPNETATTGTGPHTGRTGGPKARSAQWLTGQSRPCPEANHPGTDRRALGSPVCAGRSRRRCLVKGTCLPHGAATSMRAALSVAVSRDRTPYPRVAVPHCRQGMSATTIPAAIQHPEWGIRTPLPRIRLCTC